jgi:hypothetical protein
MNGAERFASISRRMLSEQDLERFSCLRQVSLNQKATPRFFRA